MVIKIIDRKWNKLHVLGAEISKIFAEWFEINNKMGKSVSREFFTESISTDLNEHETCMMNLHTLVISIVVYFRCLRTTGTRLVRDRKTSLICRKKQIILLIYSIWFYLKTSKSDRPPFQSFINSSSTLANEMVVILTRAAANESPLKCSLHNQNDKTKNSRVRSSALKVIHQHNNLAYQDDVAISIYRLT